MLKMPKNKTKITQANISTLELTELVLGANMKAREVNKMKVSQLKCVLAEMKRIYPYDEKKTEVRTMDIISQSHNHIEIHTVDEITGIEIHMTKDFNKGSYSDE